MKVKVESEKIGLKLNIQKMKITALARMWGPPLPCDLRCFWGLPFLVSLQPSLHPNTAQWPPSLSQRAWGWAGEGDHFLFVLGAS